MAYDIDDAIASGHIVAVETIPNSADDIEGYVVEDQSDFFDAANSQAYIVDAGKEEIYGVMVADVDLEAMDADDDPISWALDNVPAPGTGADNRMELISIEEAAEEIASRPEDFFLV